ncbi:MAG: hypothetical protein ACREH5_03860 [Candidatus Omnitrophota bacterium]
MKALKGVVTLSIVLGLAGFPLAAQAGGQDYSGQEDPNKKILKQGLLGAATGAIAAEASGGKAGTGALVGAGTNVIGGALLDTVTSSPKPQPQPVYYQQAPAPAPQYAQSSYPVQTQQPYRVEQQPMYAQPQPVYYQQPPQEDPTKKILKQGLLGAGTGAIAASASGGKAGKGALIGAGTNIIGSALLDAISGPSQPQPQPAYYQQQPYPAQQQPYYSTGPQPQKKIIRKYDSDGNVISEEEVWV